MKLLQSEENNKQSEKTAYKMKKISARHSPDRRLISRIHKEFQKFNTQNPK
jgi:hypothetical protein